MQMRLSRNCSGEMQGHPQTRQRQLLLDLIRETEGHIDAKELFKELGLVDEKRLGQAHCYYEVKGSSQHQHLVCHKCGKVIDFDCPLSEMVEKVKHEQGFVVTKAEVYLEGYCQNCAGEAGEK